MEQVRNALGASDLARPNLLTNGGFEVWQRGNGPFTGNGVFGPDRWATGLQASDTMSVSRAASSIGTRSYSAQITFTLSGGTGNSGFYQTVVTSSETNLRGTTLTFSVLAKTSVANAVRAYGGFNGTGTATLYGAYHTGSGSAELLTVTFTIPVDCTSATCGVRFSASASVEVDNAMLVVGAQPADYAPLHPADDLARCLRYYESSVDNFLCSGYALTTTVSDCVYKYLAPKGGTPIITLGALANFNVRWIGNYYAVSAIATAGTIGQDSVMINPTWAGPMTVGQGMTLFGNPGAIRVEWNP